MPSWPGTLPSTPTYDGFGRSPKANVISFGTEVGPGKTRRRSTARTKAMTARVVLTTSQLAIFETFFEVDLSDGASAFDWVDPADGAAASFRFEPSNPYSIAPLGAALWSVAMNLQRLP